MTARVPSRSGANSFVISTSMSAWLSDVRRMSLMEPMRRPPICTSSSLTSCPAFWKRIVYGVVPSPPRKTTATSTAATTSAPSATMRAVFTRGSSRYADGRSGVGADQGDCGPGDCAAEMFSPCYTAHTG